MNDSFIPTLYFCILCLLLNCFLFLYIFGLLFLGCGLRWCVCYILANCFSGLVVSPEERSSWFPKLSVCVWILGTIKEVLANVCDIIHCKATVKNLSYNQKGLSQSNDIMFQHNQSVFWLNWSRHKSPFIRFDCSALLNLLYLPANSSVWPWWVPDMTPIRFRSIIWYCEDVISTTVQYMTNPPLCSHNNQLAP